MGKTWSPSTLESLTFVKATEWAHAPKSYTSLKETELSIKIENEKDQLIHVLAIDSTDDQKQNYDTFLFSEDKIVDQDDSIVKGDQWGSLSFQIRERIN